MACFSPAPVKPAPVKPAPVKNSDQTNVSSKTEVLASSQQVGRVDCVSKLSLFDGGHLYTEIS